MSHLAHTITVWEDVLAQLRRRSVSWRGNPLSERDCNTFTEAIVMCCLHLTDLSLRHDGIGTERDIIKWAYDVCAIDVSELGSFLSDAVTELRNVAECTSYNRFKRRLASDYPFVGVVLAPIRGALGDFLQEPTARGFYPCYQFLSFLTHLSLQDLDLEVESEYEELERRLQSWSYPSSILQGMNGIMREWMTGFSLTEADLHPKHGPGAVAELPSTATQLEKYRFLGDDTLLQYVFSKHAGVDCQSYFPYPSKPWKRECKVVSVPKSLKTRRTISKEPASLMYFQQAVANRLEGFVSSHSFLRKHVDFRNQEKNGRLALRASANQKYATIDLSSASDTVTAELVKTVFRGTALYPFLVALRSCSAKLPSGKVIEIAKFAPMGSALCFPVETLIFACATEYAVRRAQRTHMGSHPSWRVYGDDIIVADILFLDIQLVLESLGFILNESKSFHSPSRFRESCGVHGYDGIDVTPMIISRRFRSIRHSITSRHAAEWAGLIDMANRCHEYELSLLRAWIIRGLLENPIAPPLFSKDGRGALYSPMPDNYRARRRLNWDFREDVVLTRNTQPSYQRWEIQVTMTRSSTVEYCKDPDMEQARYFDTLRSIENRSGDMFDPEHRVHVPCSSGHDTLKKVWVPLPYQSA